MRVATQVRILPTVALIAGSVWGCAQTEHAPLDGRLYVTSGFTDEIWILDAASGREIGVRDVDRRRGETDEPHGVAVAPDGHHWYATLSHGSPSAPPRVRDCTDSSAIGRQHAPDSRR